SAGRGQSSEPRRAGGSAELTSANCRSRRPTEERRLVVFSVNAPCERDANINATTGAGIAQSFSSSRVASKRRSTVSPVSTSNTAAWNVRLLEKLAFQLGILPPGDALLETVGRHSGKPRVTPVCYCLTGDTFWIIAQHGRDSNFVHNIEANPRV